MQFKSHFWEQKNITNWALTYFFILKNLFTMCFKASFLRRNEIANWAHTWPFCSHELTKYAIFSHLFEKNWNHKLNTSLTFKLQKRSIYHLFEIYLKSYHELIQYAFWSHIFENKNNYKLSTYIFEGQGHSTIRDRPDPLKIKKANFSGEMGVTSSWRCHALVLLEKFCP